MTTASPWRPRRILLAHTLHEGLEGWLQARRPDLEYRALDTAAITAVDVAWAEVYVGFRPPPAGDWRAFRWIHSIGAGVDAFAFRTGRPTAALLTRTSEDFGPQMGEYCVARALAVTQRLLPLAREQGERVWRPKHPTRLRGTRALVVGTGAVGRGIAHALHGVGVGVDGLSRSGARREPFHEVRPLAEFATAVGGVQWLILACPLTEESWHLLDRARLGVCGGAFLINVGRGGLVEEASLPEALERGWLSGAGLDVFEEEPLPQESPLWEKAAVMISPHISGLTTIPGAGEGFLECLDAVERGEDPRLKVDPARGY